MVSCRYLTSSLTTLEFLFFPTSTLQPNPAFTHRLVAFETAITCEEVVEFVVVEARDKRGGTLGRSEVVRTIPPEEQGLKLLSHVVAEDMLREDIVASLVVSLVPDSLMAFVLGFLTCTLFAAVLIGSCRRIPLSWRRLCLRGPRYELLAQETPLNSPCSKRAE